MTFLLLSLLSFSVLANNPKQAESFSEILSAQGRALELMDKEDKSTGLKLTEMITDIGFSKTGLLGISALRANHGIELKWKRVAAKEQLEDVLLMDDEVDAKDIDTMTETVAQIVERSGKVKADKSLRPEINRALHSFQQNISRIHVTRINGWKASGVRLDLNFSASGKLSFITNAGLNLRVRIEWALKDRPLLNPDSILVSNETKFVSKVLSDLNTISTSIATPGFELMKVGIGVGSSMAKNFFGMWKYTTGFLGTMFFVPVENPPSFFAVSIPQEIEKMELQVGGLEEESNEKIRWPLRRYPKVNFASGMQRSFRTAAFFAERARDINMKNWYIAELKTLNDISKTGFFGLAHVSARGLIEIDYKRIHP
jgi:hypothetical protein